MIPQAYIIEWRKNAPWSQPSQVEQDLVICWDIVESKLRKEQLAVRMVKEFGLIQPATMRRLGISTSEVAEILHGVRIVH